MPRSLWNGVDADTRPDLVFAAYVFCMDYHGGQWSRGYRLLSYLTTRYRPRLPDSAIAAIRRGKDDPGNEWETARSFYRGMKRKYAKLV